MHSHSSAALAQNSSTATTVTDTATAVVFMALCGAERGALARDHTANRAGGEPCARRTRRPGAGAAQTCTHRHA